MTNEETSKLQMIRSTRLLLKSLRGCAKAVDMTEKDMKYIRLIEKELVSLGPEEAVLSAQNKAEILDRQLRAVLK